MVKISGAFVCVAADIFTVSHRKEIFLFVCKFQTSFEALLYCISLEILLKDHLRTGKFNLLFVTGRLGVGSNPTGRLPAALGGELLAGWKLFSGGVV